MKFNRSLIATAMLISSTAYADMADLKIQSDLRGDYVIGVAAHDQRESVLKGEMGESQIGGYIKGMFRTRAKTLTNSEIPAADELAEGLRVFFSGQKWLGVAAIATTSKESRAEVDSRIKKAALKRTLLVTIDDLWTESYRNTSVNYKFTITVLNDSAQELAKVVSEGIHDTSSWGDDAAGEIFSKVMTDTLRKPEFAAALKG